MVKGVQIQLKAKDQEVVRLNKKVFQFEGMQLAKQLHQNITIFNNYRTGTDGEVNLSNSMVQAESHQKEP